MNIVHNNGPDVLIYKKMVFYCFDVFLLYIAWAVSLVPSPAAGLFLRDQKRQVQVTQLRSYWTSAPSISSLPFK